MFISWKQAYTFCQWTGKRLPTEAEREKAARGIIDTRAFPWGDVTPDCSLGNIILGSWVETILTCVGDITKVGSYPSGSSPYGVMDMDGNVHELVNDWYNPDYYYISPYYNSLGPSVPDVPGQAKVYRGGSWLEFVEYAHVAHRSPGGIES